MSDVRRLLSEARPSKRFHPCEALLPVDSWCVVPGRVRFGLPWPWEQCAEPAEIVDGTGAAATRVDPVATVIAPRSDGAVVFSLWRDDGNLEPLLQGLGRQIASSYQGRLRGERRVLLGGTKAVLVGVDSGHERIWRLLADWSGYLLHGELGVPASNADGYEAHLETMLATWSWG